MLLVRALYYSDAATTDPEALRALLEASRRNNARLGLTGVLIHDRGRFLQVLEGARSAVSAMLARIGADPRHRNMTLASFNEASARLYPDWRMAYDDADDAFHPVRLTDYDAAPAEAIHRQIDTYLRALGRAA